MAQWVKPSINTPACILKC